VRYVAIGDSFTEGMGDERDDGGPRGWADLVAAGLAARHPGDFWYANLAVRGRLLAPIVTAQLDAALALDPAPTILTLNGGGNDMMRAGADVARLTPLIADAVERCRRAGVQPVLLAGADPSRRLPFGRTLHQRAAALTDAVGALAAAKGVLFVNAFADAELPSPGYWSADRLHLNALGHQRVASLVLEALGAAPAGLTVAAATGPESIQGGPLAEARYYWDHVRPWLGRRLTGRSSGDGRAGKHSDWVTVEPAVTLPASRATRAHTYP